MQETVEAWLYLQVPLLGLGGQLGGVDGGG